MSARTNKVVAIGRRRIEQIQAKARGELPKIIEEISCLHYGLSKCLKEVLNAGSHSGLFSYDEFEMIGRLQVLADRMGAEVHYLYSQFCDTEDDGY